MGSEFNYFPGNSDPSEQPTRAVAGALTIREIETTSEEETMALGAAVGRVLGPGDVVYLVGELGCGKTRLAKGLVSAATGVSPDEVVSPTFTLVNSFEGRFLVHHADLFRLEEDKIEEIGLDETIEQGGALVVEWADKIEGLFDDPLRIVIITGQNENERLIRLEWDPSGSWTGRMDRVVLFSAR